MEEMIFPKWQYAIQEQKDFIKYMYADKKKSAEYISKIIGRNRKTVDNWLRYMNIPHRSISESNFITKQNNFEFTENQLDIIIGELLGDGSITCYNENRKHDYYFSINVVSKEHLIYLKKCLPYNLFSDNAPYFSPSKLRIRNNRILNEQNIWAMKSKSHPVFTELRKKWYPNGIKIIPKDLQLNPTICFHWYIGDGTLVNRYTKYNPCIFLHTDGFKEENVDFLIDLLNNLKFISTKQTDYRTNRFFIRISTKSTLDFLRWIGEPKISDYSYKWAAKEWFNYSKP